jgi:hypothetical protein
MSMFLTAEEVTELTGIKTGRGGRTRSQLQVQHLRQQGIKFWTNARGDPVVSRAQFTGEPATAEQSKRWEPSVLNKAA